MSGGMFQLVFQLVPTLKPDLTPGPADPGLRAVKNGQTGAIASKIASRRPPEGRLGEKCSNLTPKMFQLVPTLKSRRQYRTSKSRFFTDLRHFGNFASILAEKRAISWCSKFQLLLRGKVYGAFVFFSGFSRYGRLELGTILERRGLGGGRGGLGAGAAPSCPEPEGRTRA